MNSVVCCGWSVRNLFSNEQSFSKQMQGLMLELGAPLAPYKPGPTKPT